MKLLFLVIFTFVFSCSSFSSEQSQLIKEMVTMQKVEKKSINKTFNLFIRVGKSLETKMDQKMIIELARLLELTFKVDSNYYTVEPFTEIIQKNEKGFLKALKPVLPKKDYKTLKDNIKMMKDEIANGNG